jgi:hypothetical protein
LFQKKVIKLLFIKKKVIELLILSKFFHILSLKIKKEWFWIYFRLKIIHLHILFICFWYKYMWFLYELYFILCFLFVIYLSLCNIVWFFVLVLCLIFRFSAICLLLIWFQCSFNWIDRSTSVKYLFYFIWLNLFILIYL